MDLDSYEFQGNELIDLLDELKATQETARFFLEIYGEKRREHAEDVPEEFVEKPAMLEHAVERVEEVHYRLDDFFEQEHTKFPIETFEVDENGNREPYVTVMDTDADSYKEMAEALAEINGNLTNGDPSMDYSEVPSPIAAVDYSDMIIDEFRKLEKTYDMAGKAT